VTVGCSSTTRASGSSRCFMPKFTLVRGGLLFAQSQSVVAVLIAVGRENRRVSIIHGFERRGEGGWGRGEEERGLLVFKRTECNNFLDYFDRHIGYLLIPLPSPTPPNIPSSSSHPIVPRCGLNCKLFFKKSFTFVATPIPPTSLLPHPFRHSAPPPLPASLYEQQSEGKTWSL